MNVMLNNAKIFGSKKRNELGNARIKMRVFAKWRQLTFQVISKKNSLGIFSNGQCNWKLSLTVFLILKAWEQRSNLKLLYENRETGIIGGAPFSGFLYFGGISCCKIGVLEIPRQLNAAFSAYFLDIYHFFQ